MSQGDKNISAGASYYLIVLVQKYRTVRFNFTQFLSSLCCITVLEIFFKNFNRTLPTHRRPSRTWKLDFVLFIGFFTDRNCQKVLLAHSSHFLNSFFVKTFGFICSIGNTSFEKVLEKKRFLLRNGNFLYRL